MTEYLTEEQRAELERQLAGGMTDEQAAAAAEAAATAGMGTPEQQQIDAANQADLEAQQAAWAAIQQLYGLTEQ